MPCQDRPTDVYPKDLSSCQALACGTPDPCRPHSLSVSLPMWSGSLGTRSMNVTSSPSPALPGGGGRCALTLSPDAGTLYPEPRGTQNTAWHTSHRVSMSCRETAPFSCSLPVSGWGVLPIPELSVLPAPSEYSVCL